MRPLTLDYLIRRKPGWIRVVACALAVLSLAYLADRYAQLQIEQSNLRAKASKLQSALRQSSDKHGSSVAKAATDSEVVLANETINRLSVPWESLFQIVEISHFDDIALLSIQPELENHTLVLTAEAKDLTGMLEYLRRLTQGALPVNVKLMSHQVQQQDPQKPVRFVVHADWAAQ